MRNTHLTAVLAVLLSVGTAAGCGVPKEEHKKALDAQKAAFDAEMQKMQVERDAVQKERDAARADVKRLGGEVSEVSANAATLKNELGQTSADLASTQKNLQTSTEEVERLRKQREQVEKMAQAFKALALKLKSMVDSGKLSVIVRNGRMTLNLPDDILFPSGSAVLKKEGKEAIAGLATVLKDVGDRNFLVCGHTDNVPMKKGGATNWDLSAQRAVTVTKLLIDSGVDGKHLAAAGYADGDPVGDNATDDGKKKNRRTEIVLMPNIEELPVVPEGL